jgi:hypothetical protein
MNLKNTLIIIMEGGMGNKFGCVHYALQLAKECGKNIIINNVRNIHGDVGFYDLFSEKNNIEVWENTYTELDKKLPINIPFLIHKGHFKFNSEREIIFHGGMDHNQIAHYVKNVDTCVYLTDSNWNYIDLMVQSAKELKINKNVLKKVNKFCLDNKIDKNVLGIHIRTCEWYDDENQKQDAINSIYQFIQDKIIKNSNVKIFVCSDNERIENNLKSQLPDNIITIEKHHYTKKSVDAPWRHLVEDVDGRTFPYNVNRTSETVVEGFIDMLILSRTNILTEGSSSFLFFAKVYSKLNELK